LGWDCRWLESIAREEADERVQVLIVDAWLATEEVLAKYNGSLTSTRNEAEDKP
jgi:hypothetical protein